MVITQTYGNAVLNKDGQRVVDFWAVDGNIFPVGDSLDDTEMTAAQRELRGVDTRLDHLNRIGVETQVLYPSLLLAPYTQNPEIEYALCHSYNRWLSSLWLQGDGRLRWVAVPPLLSMDVVREELTFARDNGACGILMRGLECEKSLADPYFHPVWQVAADLDMPVCVHPGNNSLAHYQLYKREASSFNKLLVPAVSAFHSLATEGVPDRFPDVRWAFLEMGASWLPFALSHMTSGAGKRAENLLARNKVYVACLASDDLPHLLQYADASNLIVGPDVEAMMARHAQGTLPPALASGLLETNPRRLYGLN